MVHLSTWDSWLHSVICCGSVDMSLRGRLSQGSLPFCLCPPLSPPTLPPLSFLSAPLCLPSLPPLYPPSTSNRALEDGPGKGEGWGEFRVPIGDTSPVKEPQPHPPIWKARAMTSLGSGQLQISSVSWKPPEKVFLLQTFGSSDQVKVSCPTGPLGPGQGKLPGDHCGSHFIKSTKPLPPIQRCCQT